MTGTYIFVWECTYVRLCVCALVVEYLPFVIAVVSAEASGIDKGRQGRRSHIGDGCCLCVTQWSWFVWDLGGAVNTQEQKR